MAAVVMTVGKTVNLVTTMADKAIDEINSNYGRGSCGGGTGESGTNSCYDSSINYIAMVMVAAEILVIDEGAGEVVLTVATAVASMVAMVMVVVTTTIAEAAEVEVSYDDLHSSNIWSEGIQANIS